MFAFPTMDGNAAARTPFRVSVERVSARPRTRLDPSQRRRQLLAVAAELFRERGYSDVGLEDVAERAGVTRGLLHHYFGSKRALYLEVVEQGSKIPSGARFLPEGATGSLADLIAVSVEQWLQLIEGAGGLWVGGAMASGLGEVDVGQLLDGARDELVELMVVELPLPPDLDRDRLRAALRAFAAFLRSATDEWLVRRSIDRAEVAVLIGSTLLTLIEEVVPAMSQAAAGEPEAAEDVGEGGAG